MVPTPPAAPPPSPAQPVDGITKSITPPKAAATAATPVSAPNIQLLKKILLALGSAFYAVYVVACLALMALLPTTNPTLFPLVGAGLLVAIVGTASFLLLGIILLKRVFRMGASPRAKQRGLIRLVVTVAPALALSIAMPIKILQPAPLPIDISPQNPSELVAPLAVTISLERSVVILQNLGKRPIEYSWMKDGKPVETTVKPVSTILFERAGNYVVSVKITMHDNSVRRVSRRVTIGEEFFSVTPAQPVVEMPAVFSVAALLKDIKELNEVQWDFESDGKVDEVSKTPEIDHIFYATGPVSVTAVVDLQNKTRKTYQRTIEVRDPPPLPFPLAIKTEPQRLLGPVPLGVYFTAETDEAIREYIWNYGDGTQERDPDLKRVSHIYRTPGTYSVTLRARSASGAQVAEVSTVVRATGVLALPDLKFEGTTVKNDTVMGEAPLSVELTPKSALPLVQFSWEYPADMNADVSGARFRAVLRIEGTYEIMLLAQEPGGSSVRRPIKIIVQPPVAQPTIDIRPESGTAPLRVMFDASNSYIPEGARIAGFLWDFGDGKSKQPESGSSRMEHTFETPGEFQVTLKVVTTDNKEYTATRTIIVLRSRLAACGTASRVTVPAGGAVQLDASCSTGNVQEVMWDIRRDAEPATIVAQSDQNTYVHVFEKAGAYTVTLTVKDPGGFTDSKTIPITVQP